MKYQRLYTKCGQIINEETGKTLALIPYHNDDPESEQNARLFAASHNLLDIVQKVYHNGLLDHIPSYKRLAENILSDLEEL